MVEIDVRDLSLLIDLEQGMVSLSASVGLNNTNTTDEILMELNFIQEDGLIDDECTSKRKFFTHESSSATILVCL